MSRLLLLAFLCLIGCTRVMADPVTVSQAKEKASQFINQRAAKRVKGAAQAPKPLKMSAVGKDGSYFIFNIGDDDGFVVVSGEDATEDILGYSDSGSINPDSMPCGMRMLLDNYTEQIKYLREKGITREQNKASKGAPKRSYTVNRILARFDQDSPYNGQCPQTGQENERCVTGCVATAMAELMYAYAWPNQIFNTIPAYITAEDPDTQRKYEIDAIPSGTAINWDDILSTYDDEDESIGSEKRDAIANLMKCCGASVRMDYGKNGSGADGPPISYALQHYFGYKNAIFEYASSYGNGEEWRNKLRAEIETNTPILYVGENGNGGKHAFLLEGYDGDYFYVNFGWGGKSNDYFMLNVVRDEFTYINFQAAVFNLLPTNDISSISVPPHLWTDRLFFKGGPYQRSSETENFQNIQLSFEVTNWMPLDVNSYDLGLCFGNNISRFYTGECGYSDHIRTEPMVYASIPAGNGLGNGKYIMRLASAESGTNNWVFNDNSQHKYSEAWICGDWLSIKTTDQDEMNFSMVSYEQTDDTQLRVGLQANYQLKVTDAGSISEPYEGDLLAEVVWTTKDGVQKDSVVCINKVQCSINGETIVPISFVPFVEGEQQIRFLNKRWEPVGSITVNVISATASLDLLEVTELALRDGDVSRGLIDGTTLRGTVSMKNNDVVTKKANVIIGLEDVEAQTRRTKQVSVNIEPNSTMGYDFSFGNLTAGHHYVITASYASDEEFYRSEPLFCTTEGLGEVEPGNEALVAYEYWFDDDFDGVQSVGMNGNNAVIRASLNTQNLSSGLHTLNLRVKRSDGSYSAVTRDVFFKHDADEGNQIEYWFDDNYDNRASMPLPEGATEDLTDISFNLQDNTLFPMGLHKLNMRISTEGKSLNAVYSAWVLKLTAGDADIIEYWVDDDFDNRKTLEGHPSDGHDYVFVNSFDLSGISPGLHRIYYRTASSNGSSHSAVSMSTVVVNDCETLVLEYWFDDNYDNRASMPLPEGATEDLTDISFNLQDNTLFPMGLHKLNMRISTEGKSLNAVYSAWVLKLTAGDADIIEYWVDDDFDNRRTLEGHPSDGHDYVFVNSFDLSGVSPGLHRIYYRSASSNGSSHSAVSMSTVIVNEGETSVLECWVDNNRQNKIPLEGHESSGQDGYIFVNDLNLGAVSPGHHRLYCRAVSNSGRTVSAITSVPIIVKSKYNQEAKVTHYSISVDDETPIIRNVENPSYDFTMNYELDVHDLTTGTHTR